MYKHRIKCSNLYIHTYIYNFYFETNPLGERSHGSVYTHYRRVDRFCMAIKHIPRDNIICKGITQNRRTLHFEAVMRKVASGAAGSVVKFSAICLLDYYDLELGLILVLEFPLPSVDLCKYIDDKGESLQEEVRLIFKQNVFHRDIEVENILIETTSNVPFLMLIDLWLCYFTTKTSSYMIVHSTSAHIPTEWYRCCSSRASFITWWQLGMILYDIQAPTSSFSSLVYTWWLGSKPAGCTTVKSRFSACQSLPSRQISIVILRCKA
uniref:non-specific serine/threonine protein kinase n=1 Tax=Monopterus albus TaxID=43700 RepID=A0A3Q3IMT1_MONAL